MPGRSGGRGGSQPPNNSKHLKTVSDKQTVKEDGRDTEPAASQQEEKIEKKEDWYEEAMANAERDLAEDAEWKRIQENTFTRWVNEHLRQAGTSINDLETDFSNGLKLIALLEVLSGKKMPKHNKKPTFRSQKLENVSIALKFLETEGVHLVNIDSTHITDCKLKLIMGLIWTLILHYSISMPMYDGPELGGQIEDKTPKQRLLNWMQNKVPGVPINNFTSDWTDGIKVGALVDSVAPGLCPDWEDWDPNEPIRNATEAMDLADNWLGVPKLLTPEEIVNPNVDEQSMMTYLSQFPNAKVKDGAPFREKALASKVRAFGPGLEPTGNVAKAPAKFTVETFGAGDGELNITVKGPDGTDYKVDKTYNNDRKKSYSCSYFPDKEGDFTVPILFAGRNIPKSPFNVAIEGFAGDANKVTVAGPGVEPEGVVANRPTDFDIFTAGAGRGKPEVIVLDPHGLKDAIPVKITPSGNDVYHCEYLTNQLGVHSVNVFFAGNPIPDSPFGVRVGPASNPAKVHASGRGLQPHGVRAQELVDFKVFTEGAGEGVAGVKIIGPGGVITPTTARNVDPHTIEYKYTPERDGRYRVMITWAGKEIPRSPFEVNVSPLKSSKIKAFGPGLKGGVVDLPALFTVDTCGETGSLGFSIEGPSQAKINCNDNGDGSADVDYVPTVPGEYAVHILCDSEDIPGSPYMAQILPKTDYDPGQVKCYGPGLEEVVQPNEETHFTIDSTKAGKAPLDVLFMDDYGEVKPLWKDENGIQDPKDGGILAVKIIRAKELIKTDLIGKSDPYAVIRHGAQKFTTKVVKNSLEPEWNYEAQVTIPDQGDNAVTIELFDSDKIGKDKSLGSVTFNTSQVVREKVIEQGWYNLQGVENGQLLMSADFVSAAPTLAKDARPEHQRKMSHKNLDVRRPILEKKSEGMYECTYTPRKTQKLVICVNYGGVAVPGSPFRVTVDDPTDPNKVKVYGPGVEDGNKTGKPVDFTVDCKEAGPGDLEINITDDKNQEVPITVNDKGDHTFNVIYNPKKNGAHTIEVKYDGRDVPQSPITVNVKTDIDMKKIKVLGLEDEVFVDCSNDFEVDTSGLPANVTPNIGCAIKCPDGTNLKDLRVDQPGPEGKAKVSYTPNKEGKHEVSVSCDGDPIHGSPFKVKAKKGFDPKKVSAYGPGLEKGICHEPNQFTIETRNAGKGDLGLSIEGPAEAKMTCKDNRDGSCNVDYVPTVPGNYDIFVKLEDKNIPGSPFNVPVVDLSSKESEGNPAGQSDLPNGKLKIKVIKAKELIKADLIGKSDPYAVIKYGQQQFKTETVKNSLEPKWDYELELNVPESHYTEVSFQVFDADKIGKDKSLGVVSVNIAELAGIDGTEGRWYPLTGVKSGQILLSADFQELASSTNVDPTMAANNTKPAGEPQSQKSPLPKHGKLPPGRARVFLVKGKELIKTDLIGKVDPYATLSYGTQTCKTPTIKNSQEPKWDYCANFEIPEGDKRNVIVEVFDSDKLGKDKSLGQVELDLADLVNNEDAEGHWYPLIGVKSGKVLLFADFEEEGTFNPDDSKGAQSLKSKLKGSPDDENDDGDDNGDGSGSGRLGDDDEEKLPTGVAKINLIKAADLIKSDMIGKSDPYAVLSHGNQQDRTKTVSNTQNPQWNHQSDFDFPDGGCRTFDIEVFDADKFGKDKSLGKVTLDITDVLNEADNPKEGKWYPLEGVKTGKVLLNADFLDDLGRRPSEILKGLLKNGDPRKGSTSGLDTKSPSDNDGADLGDSDIGDRKKHPSALNGDVPHIPASALPTGKAKINLIKAKELIQADKNSKSDPYAMLLYGRQVEKTKVVQNSHDPEWNHEAEFDFPEGEERAFRVEVFDSDKVGKDTSLGHLDLDITDVLALDGQTGKWFPLSGVPKGKVLLSADFIDDLGRKAADILDNLLKGLDADGRPCRKSSSDSPSDKDSLSNLPNGTATINLIKAKDLMKLDPKEKTHPYAVLIHGRQMEKTKTIKNTTEPQWDHKADFRTPDGNSREFCIEVFDSEKQGKDNSLGTLSLDIVDVLKMDGQRGQWFPLDGANSGEILLSANFFDDLGRSPEEVLKDLLKNDNDRKKSGKPLNRPGSADSGGLGLDDGVAKINIIKAKDLVKSDLIGKSDPYALIKYGSQKDKTPVVKNSQNPEWNHTTELKVPEDGASTISIEVFDQDRIGKDKSLGKLHLDLADLQDLADVDGADGKWFPLQGVKSGQILLSGELLGPGQHSGLPSAPASLADSNNRNKSLSGQAPNDGKARVNLIKAKDLIKTDLKGKSDPYAVVKYGSQKFKTPTVKNSQEPEWDCEMEFDFPEEGGNNFNIEVFDEDRFGKDKSLGRLELSPDSLAEMDPQSGYWLPLDGVKSGEVLLSGEIADSFPDDDNNISPLGAGAETGRDDPHSVGAPPQFADHLPEGQLGVKLLKAKDLVKSDVFGKSDPYAVLSFGQQKDKTPVAKNTQNPVWNHEAQFDLPDGPDQTLNIEVFDSDKIGKDKSLGKLDIDVNDLLNNPEDNWYPLAGVKSGQVLLSSDFLPLDGLGDDGVQRKKSSDLSADNKNKKKPSIGANGSLPEGVVHLELVKAKDLEDGDKKSKSDPYAVLKYGKQKAKTNTIKNTQNPQWNFGTDFNVPDGKDKTINVEVFDNDRFGRDKSLGKLDLPVGDLLDDDQAPDGRWYPLEGSKTGQVLIASDFLSPDSVRDNKDQGGLPVGGKGTGAADPSKVLAYGPGLERGKVMPGRPASFTIDSSKTGPAPIEVSVDSDGAVSSRKPSVVESGPGKHEVTYVPPPVGKPYQVGVKYGGEDVPGSPFEMSSNADTTDVIGDSSGTPERKESKIGISVNPDDAHNLGKIHVGLIAAKDLVKSDIMGKSDPYAILSHGNQKFKTDTVKNTQNPDFNYDALFNVPDDGDNTIKIDLLDSDRFGKDKSLGKLELDVDDIMTGGVLPPTWFPLKGTKSGQVLVSADFEASDSSRFGSPERGLQGIEGDRDGRKISDGRNGRKSSDGRDGRKSSDGNNGRDGRKPSDGRDGRKPSDDRDGRKTSKEGALGLRNRLLSRDDGDNVSAEDLPEGTLHVDVLGARKLPKSDLIGKSDPYAEIGLGDQKFKTPTVKNSQDPEWNFGADFDLDGSQPPDVLLGVFDRDKFGGDKPLGSAAIPVSDLLERSTDPSAGPVWVPLAGGKSGEVLVDTNFTPGDDSSRRMSGHGTGKFRNPSKQGSSASLLGDDDSDGKNGGGGRGLKDKLKDPKSKGDGVNEDLIPGNLHLNLHKAEGLVKGDILGKSDPYAVVSFDGEKHQTKTVKNNQNPEWNFELDVPVDEDGPLNINIDVFDKDKIGKDKLLGTTQLSVPDLQTSGDLDKDWLPLDGAKSGKVQVSTDFTPDGLQPGNRSGQLPGDKAGERAGQLPGDRSDLQGDTESDIPAGNVHLALHEAQGLGKGDLIGKSDPYAVVKYDDDEVKTKTVKNNQNPDWNFETDLPVKDNGPRNIDIEVYDSDRFGKDKLLGSTSLDIGDMMDAPFNEEWLPLDGSKNGKIKVSADFNPLDDLGSSSRKTSVLEESYSRKSSTTSEVYSRKSSELFSRKTSTMSDVSSRKESQVSVSGSRRQSEMTVTGSRRQSEVSVTSGRKESQLALSGSRRPSGMKNLDDEDSSALSGSRRPSELGDNGSRKTSGMSGKDYDSEIPGPGLVNVNVHGAKDLMKKDLIGKSDPYAVLSYGGEQVKSDPVKNTQNPQWEFMAQLPVDENSPDHFNIEIFDKDKFGKDKSLGKADIDLPSIANGQSLDKDWIPLDGVKSGMIQVSADYDPDDPALSSRKSSRGGAQTLADKLSNKNRAPDGSLLADKDPSTDGRHGSLDDPYDRSGSRKGSQFFDDPSNGRGSRKNSDDPYGDRRGSQDDPSDRYGGRKGSQDDPSDRYGGRKGSQDDPSDRYGGRKGSQDDPSNRHGGRKGSQDDPSNRHGGRKGSQDDPSDMYGGRKGSQDPSDRHGGRKGSQDDPSNRHGGRKGSQDDPSDRYGGRKGSQDDPSNRYGSRKGSQYEAEDDPSSRRGSRKGSNLDGDDDVELKNRRNSGKGGPEGAGQLRDDMRRGKSFSDISEGDAVPIGNVHLEIKKAKNLIKADIIGKSDPYAVVSYGDENMKTKTIKNNLNPEWNFEADIPVDPNGPRNIKIDLFDDDKLGKDKPLGSADIDIPALINNATLKDSWIPLSGVKSGHIQVSADFAPYDESSSRKPSKSGGKLIPEPERDGMRNRGGSPGSPGEDDGFGSSPNQRKASDNKQAPGLIHLNIVQAKDLIKTDIIGKSDPFAVLTYGDEQIRTNTIKNNLNPEWNFEADIPYNPNYSDTIKLDIYDDDKLGKNKPLGSALIDIPSLANNDPLDSVWFPLSGVKSGQVQVSAEYVPSEADRTDQYRAMSPLRDSGALGAPRNAKSPLDDKLGTIKLDLLMAKDLIKTDLVGKSDPYAIISHGDQKFKSDIKKNTQNPEWNIECEIEVPDGHERNISIELYDADKFGKDKFLGKLNLDIAKIMNLGKMEDGWYPLDGVKQGQIRVGADFIPELDESSTIVINQRFTETRRSSTQLQEVSLNRIPLPSTGGSIDASIRRPSGAVDLPSVQDDNNGTVAIKYQPKEEGTHYLDVRYNNDHVQGSPFKFHVTRPNSGQASAYGPGLTHGVCGEQANFTVSTKGAGAGGLHLAVEGPSKADITCHDNKDGTVDVSYLPTAPGEYKITAKFADDHIPGSPFTCKITGEGKKRNQISVGSSSELQLPGNLTETDLRSLKAYIESPSGAVEQCFLKKLPRGNIGISFTPREVGEHLVSVQKNGKHITNSPFKIIVNSQEVGDASRVVVSGAGLVQGKTHVNNRFMINTKSAGYGGLSLSIEGPSKAEIDCKDNEDGTLDVDYKPTEPGFYIINIKFADSHVPGSPFQVPISGEGSEKMTENIKRMREAVPVTEVGSQCRLTFKMPGISVADLDATVTSPSGKSTKANVSEEEEGLYAVNFVPYELGIHTVTVRYRDVDIPGSPFQFTVGPLQDSGAHRVHAGGPGLARGVEGEPAEFNVWTREAGPGSLAISVEGPSKAQIEFLDRKDGSCYVSYVVDEAGEYSVGIRFNEQHIPDSPYKVFIIPKSGHADKVKISNLDDTEQIALNAPQSFLLSKNGASGTLQCKMVSPTGREDDCFMSQVGPDEYSVRFVPKEEGYHHLHAKLNGVHVPGSPFKIKVGGEERKDGAVKVYGQGLDRVKTGEKAAFVIDTSNVGAGTLSVTVDGPSKVDMDCNEVSLGYEVSYTPMVPGDYYVTVKYNGKNVDGSPFKVTAGGGGASGAKSQLLSRRESSSVTMETIQRTMIRQESAMFQESSRSSSRPIPIQPSFKSDGSAVTCKGPGLDRPILGKQNSFSVDCSHAGNNVLFVGIYGPEKPCDEVYVKHQGDRRYGVSYKLTDPGQYILYVKWGDEHAKGSPFHIQV